MEKAVSIMYSLQESFETKLEEIIPILVDKIDESKKMTEEYLLEQNEPSYRYTYFDYRKPTSKDIFGVMKNLYNDLTEIKYRLADMLNTSSHNSYEILDDCIKNNGASLNGVSQYILSSIKLYDKYKDCLEVGFIPHSTRTNVVIIKDKILTDIFIDIINKRNEIMVCE